jgi:hypothetical protein
MKKILNILVVFVIVSCSSNSKDKNWELVKSSRSISEYQNFLISNPETDHFIEAIDSLKILWKRKVELEGCQYGHGNTIQLLINKEDMIYFNREFVKVQDLSEKVRYAISNPDQIESLPETKQVEIEGLGNWEQSRGLVDIKSDSLINKDFYSKVLKQVIKGFYLMRNDLAIKKYGIEYAKNDSKIKDIINQAIPIKIRFERYIIPPDLRPIGNDSIIIQDKVEILEDDLLK